MTREQEINNAALKYIEENSMEDGYVVLSDYKDSFIEGAEWADANPKQTWISVNEKLPPIEKDNLSIKVLVVSTKGKIDFSRYDYDMKGWISPVLDIEFTHWMPLPKLPKLQK